MRIWLIIIAAIGYAPLLGQIITFDEDSRALSASYGDTMVIKTDTAFVLGMDPITQLSKNLVELKYFETLADSMMAVNADLIRILKANQHDVERMSANNMILENQLDSLNRLSGDTRESHSELDSLNASQSVLNSTAESSIQRLEELNELQADQINQLGRQIRRQMFISGGIGLLVGILIPMNRK